MRARRQKSTGQALVLFALFMLVLVLAAIATMSLSHLAHQKMELQVAADTAAYSQAVATARTYNSVALMNRAQVATMVAMQGIHSSVSFAGTYRGAINAAMYAYEDDFNTEFGKCSRRNYEINTTTSGPNTGPDARNACELIDWSYDEDSCDRAKPGGLSINIFGFHLRIRFDFVCSGEACEAHDDVMGDQGFLALDCNRIPGTGRVPALKREWCRVRDVWNALDEAAGQQGKYAQDEAIELGVMEGEALNGTLPGALPGLANNSVGVIGGATSADISVSMQEVGRAHAGGGSFNGLDAALGSRAHHFISQRADGDRAIEEQLQRVVAVAGAQPDEIRVLSSFKGSSFFYEPGLFDAAYSFAHGARDPKAYASWGDEHGEVSVSYNGPFRNLRTNGVADTRHDRWFKGSQSSTDLQHRGDKHDWCPLDLNAEDADPAERHTLRPHRMPPPNEPDPCQNSSCIWPGFYDVNAMVIENRADAYGQPKLMTVASKDLAGQKDPWNMFLRFKFARSGAGERTDFTQKHALKGTGLTPDFQVLSSGMAYYHRPGHWKEHPNFFNPYWRASLVKTSIDQGWESHITNNVSGSNGAAFSALRAAGYEGIP